MAFARRLQVSVGQLDVLALTTRSEEPEVREQPGDSVDDLADGCERFGGLVGPVRARIRRRPARPAPARYSLGRAGAQPQPLRHSIASAVTLPRLVPDYPDNRCRADLLNERIRYREPSRQGTQNGVHRPPEPLFGSLGRLIQVATRHLADDQDVDIVRCTARDAFISCGPGSVDRYRDRVQRAEFLADDKAGAERECDELGERAGVPAGRVRRHQPGAPDTTFMDQLSTGQAGQFPLYRRQRQAELAGYVAHAVLGVRVEQQKGKYLGKVLGAQDGQQRRRFT